MVQSLTEGNEYKFRIIAVNDNGLSPPLEGVNSIKAKSPYSKFIFNLNVVLNLLTLS